MVESSLCSMSLRSLVNCCKEQLAIMFGCERVNMILVDRIRKDFYTYSHDSELGIQRTKSFAIEQSLAAHSAISCHSIYTEKVEDESRFIREIDDPQSYRNDNLPKARQIITCPIFSLCDFKNSSNISNLPRAVIQLINKDSNKDFD